MGNLNKVLLMGRLTRDPELRYTPQGTPVADLGIAVNREYAAGNERRKETTFVDVTIWRRQAEVICQYLHKGDPLFIEGRLNLDTWEGQDGQKRSKLRVVADNFQFVSGRGDGGGGSQYRESEGGADYGASYRGGEDRPARAPASGAPAGGEPGESGGFSEDDIPF